MKVVVFQPGLVRPHITADRRTRRANIDLEITQLHGPGSGIEQRDEHAELAVLRREDARRGGGVESRERLPTLVLIARDPDADAAPSHDFQPGRAQVALDRGEVVPNDPGRQLELSRDRVERRGLLVHEE